MIENFIKKWTKLKGKAGSQMFIEDKDGNSLGETEDINDNGMNISKMY